MTWLLLVLLLLSACGTEKSSSRSDGAQDEPDFSVPAEGGRSTPEIRTRADLELLPVSTSFITAGDNGSPDLSSDDLETLSRFTHLQRLHLRHCRGIGNSGMEYIAALTSLRDLDLSGCTALTGTGIAKLATLKHLNELRLNFCPKVTRADVESLQRAMPRADIVWSSDDPPLGAPPDHPPR
jgi:hypothetical protein